MKLYTLLFISAIAVTSCAQNTGSNTPKETGTTVNQAQKGIINLSQADFKKSHEKAAGLQIVDVRTPGEIASGKIGKAKELDFTDPNFAAKIDALGLDKSKPVVLYCAVGGRSAGAAKVFQAKGFTTVYNLIGGYNAYK